MRRSSHIVSIFGQIEGVVARAMAKEKLVTLIERDMIPETARWDDQGRLAECAIVLIPETERAFDFRVRQLRS